MKVIKGLFKQNPQSQKSIFQSKTKRLYNQQIDTKWNSEWYTSVIRKIIPNGSSQRQEKRSTRKRMEMWVKQTLTLWNNNKGYLWSL